MLYNPGMIANEVFTGLAAVLAVAETKSFTAAAARLGVSAAAVSQTVKEVERRLGTPLFARTTRRVGLTEAGEAFLARVRPAVGEIAAATEAAALMSRRPVGLLRLTVPRIALDMVVAPVLAAYREACPEVRVEIAVDDTAIDLAAGGFDAGIRIGELIERDMIAVRLTPAFRWIVVGSPAYFARNGRPATPEALAEHALIGYRFPGSGALYRWEFVRAKREFTVAAHGPIAVNDGGLAIDCALRGLGLTYTADRIAAPHLNAGRLEAVLTAFAPESPGFHLYFPNRAQAQPKLRAFIDVARRVLPR